MCGERLIMLTHSISRCSLE